MAKANSPTPSKASAPSPRRLRVLLGMLLVVAVIAGAWWAYRTWPPTLPDIPEIDVATADPEIAGAVRDARRDVVKAPRSKEAWARLAMVLHAHKYHDEAVICYTAVGALDPDNPFWPYLQGMILQGGTEPAQALPPLQRAARLAPRDSPMPRLRLAQLLWDLGQRKEAKAEFARVLADHPDSAHARFGLAQVAIAQGAFDDALGHLHAIAGDAHVRKRSCALRAAVCERLGKAEDADRERRRLADLSEDVPWPDIVDQIDEMRVGLEARIARANALVRRGQIADAARAMDETVRLYPKSDQAWAALGVAKELAKDFAAAEFALNKSIELAPDRAEHRFTLGEFLQARKRFAEAADAYRRALERRPADAEGYFKLGECLQALNDKKGAADAYRQALRYRPDMKQAREQLDKVS